MKFLPGEEKALA